MITVMWLLRRKAGVTFEQFRDHYETSHAVLGAKYLGHLLLGYRRNYVLPATAGEGGSDLTRRVFQSKAWDYDCIAEWDLADEEAFAQALAIVADPEIGKIFYEDEEHFLDRASVRLVRIDQRQTDTSACVPPDALPRSPGTANLWEV